MESITISVIVPVYNSAAWLERCITSIRNQTYHDLEIIIVNDGSADQSGIIADRLAREDGRIKVFHKDNGGASTARNLGLEMAVGNYIGFVDSDDYVEPDMYDRLLKLVRERDLLIAQASRDEIDEAGNKLPDVCLPPEKELVTGSRDFIRELLLHRGDASFCTKLVKATLFAEDRFPEGVLNEDLHLLIRLLTRAEQVAIVPEQYYHVCYRSDSTTRKKSKEEFSRVFLDIVDNADMMEAVVARDYPDLTVEARRFALYQRLEYLLHVPIGQMNGKNDFYRQVLSYIRKHLGSCIRNPYLSKKHKLYLMIFCLLPKSARKIHVLLKGQALRQM